MPKPQCRPRTAGLRRLSRRSAKGRIHRNSGHRPPIHATRLSEWWHWNTPQLVGPSCPSSIRVLASKLQRPVALCASLTADRGRRRPDPRTRRAAPQPSHEREPQRIRPNRVRDRTRSAGWSARRRGARPLLGRTLGWRAREGCAVRAILPAFSGSAAISVGAEPSRGSRTLLRGPSPHFGHSLSRGRRHPTPCWRP